MSIPFLLALYCLEAGLFFAIVPWTRMWVLNPMLHHNIAITMWADNPFVRGLVSGFGVIHLIIGVRDIIEFSRQRRRAGGTS